MNKKRGMVLICMLMAVLMMLSACGGAGGAASTAASGASLATSGAASSSGSVSAASTAEILKGVLDLFVKDDTYATYKELFKGATFEEKLDGDSIVVTAKGNAGVEGTYTFPVKDGYLTFEMNSKNVAGAVLFTYLSGCVGKYYGINKLLFMGYLNGLTNMGIKSNAYEMDIKPDSTGSMKLYIAGKPDMKELNEIYFNDKCMDAFGDATSSFMTNVGKVIINSSIDGINGNLQIVIGEYEKNTDVTYKSVLTIVNRLKPKGYEAFLKDFTEIKEISAKDYKVMTDCDAYMKEHEIEKPDGYKYIVVMIGENQ